MDVRLIYAGTAVTLLFANAACAGMWGEGRKSLQGVQTAQAEVLLSLGDVEMAHSGLSERQLKESLESWLTKAGLTPPDPGQQAQVSVILVLSAIYLEKLDHFIFEYTLQVRERADLLRGNKDVDVITYEDRSGPGICPAAEFGQNILNGLGMKMLMLKSNISRAKTM